MRKRPEFKRCFDSGRRLTSKNFIVYALPRESGDPWRLGLAVSRKVGGAVQRNRVKRVVREFFRVHQQDLGAPYDIVVVAKTGLDAARVTLGSVTGELTPLVARLRRHAAEPAQGRG